MKPQARKAVSALMAFIFLISSAMLIKRIYDDHRADGAIETAREIAAGRISDSSSLENLPDEAVPEAYAPGKSQPEEDEETYPPLEKQALYLLELDLEALRQVNPDVLGWIYIPDTVVDYPLMAYEDNETGLDTGWDGSRNSLGSIFLECMNRRDLSDFNTLIYGHHIRKGSMFGSLKYYADEEYARSHALIYIVTEDHVRRYQVFSAYEADIDSDTYRLYVNDDETRQAALDHFIGSSQIETGLIPGTDDRILTLSTCMGTGTYSTRWVVQAVLTGEFKR